MKKSIVVIALFISVASFGQVESVSLQASGLTCSMCSRAIYKSLMKVSTVAKVTEDIEHSSYTIEFRENQPIVFDDIRKAVKDAGFSVAKMEVRARFNHTSIPKDGPLLFDDISFVLVGVPDRELDGEKKLLLVDKDFLPEKERLKYARLQSPAEGSKPGNAGAATRVYHITIRQS